jgi:hypothetical protein
MSVPYDPSTLFPESFPVLEYSGGEGGALWIDGQILDSPVFDVIDFLPAWRANGVNPNFAFNAINGASDFPEARFTLDYFIWLDDVATVPAGSHILFEVFSSAALNINPIAIFAFDLTGAPADIAYGPRGGVQDLLSTAHHGTCRITGRRLLVRFHTIGGVPANFSFGAYLRIY